MVISDLVYLRPELIVVLMASLLLVFDRLLLRISRWIPYLLVQATLFGALLFTLGMVNWEPMSLFQDAFVMDGISNVLKAMLCIYAIFVFTYSRPYLWERQMFNGEYFVLCLFSILGMMILVSARNFLSLYLGLELLALPLYALIAWFKEDGQGFEAAMKYFVMGAIASGMLLYGISLLYGSTGSLEMSVVSSALTSNAAHKSSAVLFGIVFLVVGLAFKFGAVPFHMWVPDIYEGSPHSVTLFIGTLPKLAAFGMAIRLLVNSLQAFQSEWQLLLTIIAVLSMGVGNIAAIAQSNLKRMLAYSAIAHVGFLLLGLLAGPGAGYGAALIYTLIYSAMALGIFGIILALSSSGVACDTLSDLRGLGTHRPWIAFLMLLIMLSLTGIPPTVGFYAKFRVLEALIQVDRMWLAILAVVFSVIGAFYYLRVIRMMFFESAPENASHATRAFSRSEMALLSLNGVAVLLLGVYPVPIFRLAEISF